MYMCALISYSGKDSLYVSDSHLYFVVGMLILWSRVAIPGTRFRLSMYLLPAWLELDRQQGHEGRGAIAGRPPMPFPADAGTPPIDRHSRQWRTWNVAKWPGEGVSGGARPGKRNGWSAPRWWARELPCPPPRQMPLDNRSTSREGGRAKRLQQLGFLCRDTRQNADVEHDGGRDNRPAPRRHVQETQGPPSDAAGQSADISVVFLVPYKGRLKRPCLHCRAKRNYGYQRPVAALSPTTAVVKQTSYRLIASAEQQVAIVLLTIGPIVGRSLVSILGSREISFPGSRKKDQDSRLLSLVNIPTLLHCQLSDFCNF